MFALERKSCGRHEPYGQNMQAPGPLNDARREGFAESQCWGGGEVPVVASDRERTGHDRGTKVTTESLSATMRRAQSVAGDLSCAFSNWRSPVYSL